MPPPFFKPGPIIEQPYYNMTNGRLTPQSQDKQDHRRKTKNHSRMQGDKRYRTRNKSQDHGQRHHKNK